MRPTLPRRPTARLALAAAVALACPATAPAQVQEVRPPGVPVDAADAGTGVYVRDAAVAANQFDLAERMTRQGQYDTAAEVYQEISTAYAGRLVPAGTGADGRVSRYADVRDAVQDRLAAWPAEGRAVYQNRYGPEADAALAAAGGASAADADLQSVFNRYFVNDAAASAGERLVARAFERGDFAVAARVGRRLVDRHPLYAADAGPGDADRGGVGADRRAAMLYRVAVADHLAGDDARAGAALDDLKKSRPGATATVGGESVALADSLAEQLATPTAVVAGDQGIAADRWPMPFGAPDRSRVPADAEAGGLARLHAVDLKPAYAADVPANNLKELQDARRQDRAAGRTTGILPAIDAGQLFFQDNARVYAVDLESGLPLPGWQRTYPDADGTFAVKAWRTPPGRTLATVVTGTPDAGSVLAIVGHPDPQAAGLTGTAGGDDHQLVSLDRVTGRKAWSVRLDGLPVPREDQNLRQLEMVGSPLVVTDAVAGEIGSPGAGPAGGRGRVYVLARGTAGGQFRDSYLVCLDLADGAYRWSTYLASSGLTADQFRGNFGGFDDGSGDAGDGASHLAYAGGRVFAATNLGAVAAVDAADGSVAWLSVYDRPGANADPADAARNLRFRLRARRGQDRPTDAAYKANPVVVRGDRVFALPSDGSDVLVYDAGTGEVVKSIDRSKYDDADTLLAVAGAKGPGTAGDNLVIASDKRVYMVNWPAYDAAADPLRTLFAATNPFLLPGSDDQGAIRGRPFVTDSAVYVPTASGMAKATLSGGRQQDVAGGEWGEGELPGNVVALGGYLVVAGPTRVSVYTDPESIRRRLDAAVAAAPGEAGPRLRYAEVMFTAGQTDLAAAKLDEAIGLLGGDPTAAAGAGETGEPSASMRPGADRERLYGDAIAFASRLAGRDARRGLYDARAQVLALLDRAALSADTPRQRAGGRLARGVYLSARGVSADNAAAVGAYQAVLDDPALRAAPVGGGSAGAVAEDAIAGMVRRFGPNVYADVARRAQAALDAVPTPAPDAATPAGAGGSGRGSGDAYLAVADQFPNAPAAAVALRDAGETFEQSGDRRSAARALRRLFARPELSDEQRPVVLEAMARNYLATLGRHEVALARLDRAAAMNNGLGAAKPLERPLALPDGTALDAQTVGDAAEALRGRLTQLAEAALPDLKLPPGVLAGGDPLAQTFDPSRAVVVEGVASIVPPTAGGDRHDRVVTYSPAGELAGVSAFAPGGAAPLFTARIPAAPATGGGPTPAPDAPFAAAWAGDALVVWSGSAVTAFDGATGAASWSTRLADLSDAPSPDAPDEGDDSTRRDLGDVLAAGATVPPLPDLGPAPDGGDLEELGDLAGLPPQVRRQMILARRQQLAGGANGRVRVQVRINGRQVVNLDNRAAADGAGDPDGGGGTTAEAIVAARVAGDRLVFATDAGRVAALDLATGGLSWQRGLADRAPVRLDATDDFVAAGWGGVSGFRLAALDAATGRPRLVKDFDAGARPTNLALAADGTLVWLLPDRVVVKDLFEPDDAVSHDHPVRGRGASPPFLFSTAPDQLVVGDGRILAVSDAAPAEPSGAATQRVLAFALADAEPLAFDSPEAGRAVEVEFNPKQSDVAVGLRVVGPRLYVAGPSSLVAYRLGYPGQTWERWRDVSLDGATRFAAVGRGAVLTIDEPAARTESSPPAGLPAVAPVVGPADDGREAEPASDKPSLPMLRVMTFSREQLEDGTETGQMRPVFDLTDPAGVSPGDWQAVDGGLYYRTVDGRLHFLPGAGGSAGAGG